MKRPAAIIFFIALILVLFVGVSSAVDVTIFGPTQYLQTKGKPQIYTETFDAAPGEGTLIITNGDANGKHRISIAIILLNGEKLFGVNDFNQQIGQQIAAIDLNENNTISVELRSKPNSYIIVEIIQKAEPPTVTIQADPETISVGQFSNLTWSSTGTDTCTIEPGIGIVDANGTIQVSPEKTTTYTITATGPGGTATAASTITVSNPAPTVNISASPMVIQPGERFVLSWTSTNADSCVIEPGIGSVDVNGSIVTSARQTTTYTITATGPGGITEVIVTVIVSSPPTVEISANPLTIPAGSSSTLTWSSTDADSCDIEPGIGSVDVNGSIQVSPTTTTTYAINATGPGGSASSSVTVTVLQPPTVNIVAYPEIILFGESSSLSWSSTYAQSCTIQPGIGSVPVIGSIQVSPAETTTYIITATGAGGTTTASVTVTVTYPAPSVSLSANSQGIVVGESSVLIWDTASADIVTIAPGIGGVAPNGSLTVTPTETTTYILTATGPGGITTKTTTVSVYMPPPNVSVGSDPGTIQASESSILSWTSSNAQSCSIDNGIGVVPANGSVTVSPEHTTTYTIIATGPSGSASAHAIISVVGNPEPQPEGSFGSQYQDLIPTDATIVEYDTARFSIVTGKVQDMNDLPVEGVSITVLHHPEYGTALTDTKGLFSIPVDGGETVTLIYQKAGLITVHRQVYVPWNEYAVAETIRMISADPIATTLTFDGDPNTVVTHRSTEVADEFGSRSTTMVFAGDNKAYIVDENGNDIEELSTITTRATEFTSPESMPEQLPPTSAYTYCVELSVDGTQRVRFEKPVIIWVDNFLGFDVGEFVPVGYYDRTKGTWIASENGIVVKLLDNDADGVVDAIDADGDDQPDDLNNNGSLSDEVTGLGDVLRYPPGSTFWRVKVAHFSPWDFNWPAGPPLNAVSPIGVGEVIVDIPKDEDSVSTPKDIKCLNSYVEQRGRVFHEDIPIPGTDISLHYASNRVKGYVQKITVPASGDSVPNSLKRIIVQVSMAGQTFEQILGPLPDQNAEFVWDGLDYLGRPVNGPVTVRIGVGYEYDQFYYAAPRNVLLAFGRTSGIPTGINARTQVVLWKRNLIRLYGKTAGIADGWTLSAHHLLSPQDPSVLLKGDGTLNKNNISMITTIAGNGTYGSSGDGGPATEAQFMYPTGAALDAAGNFYVADWYAHLVRKVDRNGIITTVAGNGTYGYSGDGGPATEAQLCNPHDVTVDDSGNVYFPEMCNNIIRKVDTNGIITTVAGTGVQGYGGDGGPATEAFLNYPRSVAVDASGNLYIADRYNHRIRKVDTNGIITTVAGTGVQGFGADGVPATQSAVREPFCVAVNLSGNLYIAERYNNRIRKVDTSGIITTVAGTGVQGYSGDGSPATEAQLSQPCYVSVDTSGVIYIQDHLNFCMRKVDASGIITTIAGTGVQGYSGDGGPAIEAQFLYADGIAVDTKSRIYTTDCQNRRIRMINTPASLSDVMNEGNIAFAEADNLCHIMSNTGLHLRTIDLDSNIALKTFGYDAENNLVTITDRFGNQTSVQRDGNGVPVAIVSPDGITTGLTIDSNNQLTRITLPDGNYYSFEYTSGDQMTAEVEPKGNRFEHQYNSTGRLTDVFDEEGGHWSYQSTIYPNGDVLNELLSGEGDLTQFLDYTDSTGAYTSTVQDPTGAETFFDQSDDGLEVNESLPCGMEITYIYDLDREYKFKFVKEMTETTPSGLEKITLRDKTYQDNNDDDIPDLITQALTVNGKTTTVVNNTLQSKKVMTSPEGRVVTTIYDPDMLLTQNISIPGLFDTSYGYDSRGRLTAIYTNSREIDYTYNTQGFLETVTDSKGFVTTCVYDDMGRIIQVDRPDTSSVWFTYDKNGNMTMLTNPFSIDHGFGFNAVNLNNSYQTPLSGSYSYVYDKDRRLIRTNFPSGNQISNIYAEGRLEQIQTPEGNIDYTYLCGTKIDSIAKGTESVTYGYDGKLVTSETFSGALNQVLSYTYNDDFNLFRFDYAGTSVGYVYDNDGLLTGAGNFSITHNAQNGLPEVVTGGALSLSRSFNGYGEVSSEGYAVNGQSLASWTLTRDDNGRITNKAETIDGANANYAYTYDPMGRLLTVTKDSALVEEYEYDANGTRISEMNTLRGISGKNFSYDDEDRLLTAGTASYQYNVDGFLITKIKGTDVTTYNYSSRGELLNVTLSNGTLIEYVHNPLGRRIAKKVNGIVTEKYLWQGLTRLLAVYDGSDNLLMRFEYADARMPFVMIKGGATYYLTYDQVGSLTVVADASGNVVKKIQYDAFGNIINDTNLSFEVPFGFAGGLLDGDTRLIRFGYRDYDPDNGRWTAKDPIFFNGGDTDFYGYCINDPINLVDPNGLKEFEMRIWVGGSVGYTIVGGGVYTATVRDIETGKTTLYSIKAMGLGVGLPSLRGSSRPIRFKTDDPCITTESFEGYGYLGGASAEVIAGVKLGGGIKIPHGPFIPGKTIDWERGGFDIGVSHNLTYWSQ